MKDSPNVPHQPQWGGHVSTKSYAAGYIISLLLTLAAFLIVEQKLITGMTLPAILFALALTQAVAQLVCFFNLGKEAKPAWNLIAFIFMLVLLTIVVVGSLFIMYSLDYRMMLK